MKNDNEKFKKEFKKRLYTFVLRLIVFLDKLPKDTITQVVVKQLMRSGTSIVANYIEAQSASSKKGFINFFHHSLKSTNESKLWFSILKDTKRVTSGEVEWFLKELNEISNIFDQVY